MSPNKHFINPLTVRALRIHLSKHELVTWKQLADLAGYRLTKYMINQPGFPEQDLTEEDGLHWRCRDLARWMREHPVLKELYVEGKRQHNPSRRTAEDNERSRLRKLGKL